MILSGALMAGFGYVSNAIDHSFACAGIGLAVFAIGVLGALVTYILEKKSEAKNKAIPK